MGVGTFLFLFPPLSWILWKIEPIMDEYIRFMLIGMFCLGSAITSLFAHAYYQSQYSKPTVKIDE